MSAQPQAEEAPKWALLKACRQHVEKALKSLKNAEDPEATHEVRKEIKKMRATFRLTRGGLSRKGYRNTAKVMRLAAKPLAASRDARVTQKALEALIGKKDRQHLNLQSALKKYSAREQRSFRDHDAAGVAKYLLKKAGDKLDGLKLNDTGWVEVRDCLVKTYSRGRDSYQQAILKPTPENLHEWRKQVKNFWYQLDFLCPEWPEKTKKLLEELETLADHLGDDHDLVLFSYFAEEQCDNRKEASEIRKLIDSKRREYTAAARRLGSRIYARPPGPMCDQLEKDWKTWRKGR